MNREMMLALAQERAVGAATPVDPCRVYDSSGTYIYFSDNAPDLDLCHGCADELVARRNQLGDNIETFPGGEEADVIHHCGGCGIPILDALTPSGAADELEHWEHFGLPRSQDCWRDFARMVEGLDEGLLPRVSALLKQLDASIDARGAT